MGLSIKDVRSQRGLSSANILRTQGEGILQMRTSALFGAKNFGFFEIYGGLSHCGHFADKGGDNFL